MVTRIKRLAPETETAIKKSNSPESVVDSNIPNCRSGNLNLHHYVKWRSFEILSKDALIKIIGILLNEIESSRKSGDGKRGSEQPKSFPKKLDSKTGKSKRICWYFNNSTCKFGKFCWNLHRRLEKLDNDKKSPQKRNGKLKSRKTLDKTSEKSESLKEAVLDSSDLKLSIEVLV